MSDELFPSGPWIGFYTFKGPADKHRMDLDLTFSQGKLSGDGIDDIGLFLIRGTYDAGNRDCHWVKQYVGKHAVDYRGFREGKGIWGTWEIQNVRGGFHIWPLRSGSGDEIGKSVEKPEPVEAVGRELLPLNR